MSEYQYYEFRAVDRPLECEAQAELRKITSRAEITPTSLVNEYHWGDFKGSPDRLMDKYFDAHLYYANWGSRRFMLRLPLKSFSLNSARPYLVPNGFAARATKEHVVLDFRSESEDGWEEFEEMSLAALLPLRDDLIRGDLRCLYLAWLAGVNDREVDEDDPEPPVPPGLMDLSGSLVDFADFLRIDPDLIGAAAMGSHGEPPAAPGTKELRDWLGHIPAAEKDDYLARLMSGEGVGLAGELLHRFRTTQSPQPKKREPSGRTVGQLLTLREEIHQEEQRLKAERKRAARARHLDSQAGREKQLWQEVEAALASRSRDYTRVVEILVDLRDLAQRSGDSESFSNRMRQLRDKHAGKRALMERLDRAGLPKAEPVTAIRHASRE